MMNTFTDFPQDKTLIDLFEEQVLRTPDNIAVEFEGEELSYQELNSRANQLGNYLVSLGVVEDSLVPICLSRSLDMIIATLGVLKAGGAYVPVDPEYPIDRIEYTLNDTNGTVIIAELDGPLSQKTCKCPLLFLDLHWTAIEEESKESPKTNLQPNHLAYVIYTSGSTGRPKGVMIEHRNLSNFLLSMLQSPGIKEDDRMLAITTTAFDIAGLELFLPLICGAVVVLTTREVAKDGVSLYELILKKDITIAQATPATWYMLIESGWKTRLSLKALCGGEAFPRDLAEKLLNLTAEVWNMYGPTESTIWSSIKQINHADDMTIGNPVDNTNFYILDADLHEVEPGEIGELFIGGKGVARGYLNRDELTKSKFVKNPFAETDDCIYQTGDQGKRLPNGEFVCLGRLDEQIKLRGFRIETGEIENTLLEVENIKKAVVVVSDKHGLKQLIAYIIGHSPIETKSIRSYLETKLPEYMIPNSFVEVAEFPLTPNGKIDKKSLSNAKPVRATVHMEAETKSEKQMAEAWKETLKLEAVGIDDNFFELGGNSLLAQKLSAHLIEGGIQLPVTKLYQFPTIKQAAGFVTGDINPKNRGKKPTPIREGKDIAVIAMAGRFPGAYSVDELWQNLKAGKEGIQFFTDEELDFTIPESMSTHPNYVRARGVIEDADKFDPAFFSMNLKTAELMDPQQRVFLEICWEALERSGLAKNADRYTVGVFAGASHNSYYTHNLLSNPDAIEAIGEFQALTLNDKDYLSSRVAYSLNLTGPAITVQSACSTSLLAISQAVESIRCGQCDLALAGGVAINPPVNRGHIYHEGAMFSKDGHTNAFDVNAHGTVFSDGAGVVLLKSREQAESDGDTIFAVIKGVGINNDGSNKGSFTAPNSEGQCGAITMALQDAKVDPSSISYIEAHGTGTPLGDPIELEGLKLAFGHQEKKEFCSIGSIKSNIGHLTVAAGVAGFIKTCLSLYYKQIPASINFRKPNPLLELADSPFYVNDKLKEWNSDSVRRAGMSSFGVGGTNVHVVLEEHVAGLASKSTSKPFEVICWSAKSVVSKNAYAEKLKAFVDQKTDCSLADLAYTLHQRNDFSQRSFVVASDLEELSSELERLARPSSETSNAPNRFSQIVFVFPGQGAQYIHMGRELYRNETVFKNAVDECATLLELEIGEDIRKVMYSDANDDSSSELLNNTYYTQPAIFITEYALAKTWMHLGVMPSLFIGHSIGEFVAAHLAGVFSLKDAIYLIASRAKLMADLPKGSMLAVRSNVEVLKSILPAELSIAAINSPTLSVVAGSDEAVDDFDEALKAQGIISKQLRTSHAFHSHMMDPIVGPFENIVKSVSLCIPTTPIISTLTGEWMLDSEATDPTYWAKHLREPVRFSEAVNTLLNQGEATIVLECGPGNSSCALIRQHTSRKDIVAVASLDYQPDRNEYYSFAKALGQLWSNGVAIDWEKYYHTQKRKAIASVPTYAFERKVCWLEPGVLQLKPQTLMNHPAHAVNSPEIEKQLLSSPGNMKEQIIKRITQILENASGIDINGLDPECSFLEMGFDSLLLTQVAFTFKKQFDLPITFRQLMEEYSSVDDLADYLIANLSENSLEEYRTIKTTETAAPSITLPTPTIDLNEPTALNLISQQMQLLSQQIALLQGGTKPESAVPPAATPAAKTTIFDEISPEEAKELKKPFGATAKIEKYSRELNQAQKVFLADVIRRYNEKTKQSKEYTQEHRAIMADPRVVSGFRPDTKELVYPIVANKSKGSYIWDLDANRYIDMLNGFGSNLLGYQPDFIKAALIDQINDGYEIGPQHVLAGEVSKLICEFTNHERAALCNTGSEAVLGAMRIARSVTGRSLIVAFTGSYHGITDEVLVRGTKKLKTFPAASGIMPEAVQNMLILDYGTEESLQIIKERASEIAAVLVEPVQSRRPEYQPIEFLKSLRSLTSQEDIALIFDEIITGFRMHPGGVQALFDIKADLATYGKVVGGGISIGIIAGKGKYMDALDGGYWSFGDDTSPEVGVTYFAGTFVRHPLALATAKASLLYMKEQGPGLQERINEKAKGLASDLQNLCTSYNLPMFVARFGSMWKIKFREDYPYQELLFTLLRVKNVHILDGFPCFITDSHTQEELDFVVQKFEESILELIAADFIPVEKSIEDTRQDRELSFEEPPMKGALLGKDAEGNPAWFLPDDNLPGAYVQVSY